MPPIPHGCYSNKLLTTFNVGSVQPNLMLSLSDTNPLSYSFVSGFLSNPIFRFYHFGDDS